MYVTGITPSPEKKYHVLIYMIYVYGSLTCCPKGKQYVHNILGKDTVHKRDCTSYFKTTFQESK